ncbi:MAG: HlyD family type I secretion periplasmic adaptor subunit [Methylibium sp.]|uniref:HlyD family type I secretion periplasmic adaptor subunit n=1 Tax=Methylibium sp. TaxID=2067992 RepID=UPI0017D49D77|nr:HlyD family type I secretion periplasmic adaptor subunit [Methylibium sp.]MBA3596307.1 HlyD family type I secretion periplasmic adaptor subunit [Methylibium sp.]
MTAAIHSLPVPFRPRSNSEHARRLRRAGLAIVCGAVLPIGAWLALAPLSMAVVAPAFVKVDLNRRPVQHLEGGIVRSVLVRDGQRVKAGDPVLVLGDVGVDADRNRLRLRLHVEQATFARLVAEQTFARTPDFGDELLAAATEDVRVARVVEKEQTLFDARRHSLLSERALLVTQRLRVQSEIGALHAQIGKAQTSLALQQRDLERSQGLLAEGFISQTRVGQAEATVADYASQLEERRSELARAQQRLVDSDLKMQSARNQYTQAASDQLQTVSARLGELEQELRKTEDAATRQVVTAPASGDVIDLKFSSPGAVVRPGESIAEIVPIDTQLVIEARISPQELNNVEHGQPARIKFTAFKHRNMPMVTGRVTYVSADRLTDKTDGAPYYSVTIAADAESVGAVADLKLQAGMPAEVYIQGIQQTPFQYLAEPITSTLRKAARQM